MKNTALALFASLIFFGWTALAAGVIAGFAGAPALATHAHRHHDAPVRAVEPAPLYSDATPAAPRNFN